jgi:hypothetical protein
MDAEHLIRVAQDHHRCALEDGLYDDEEIEDMENLDDGSYDQTILVNGKAVATLRPLGDGEMRIVMHRGTRDEARVSYDIEEASRGEEIETDSNM